MTIAPIYSNQYRWRRWSSVYPDLGDLSEAQVVDLGCGIGDQTRDLSRLGAHVLGVDMNEDAIEYAQGRGIPRARFLCENITNLKDQQLASDGVWTSFTVAYFPEFEELLRSVEAVLKPGGWLAITEVDDFFGHEPLDSRWRAVIEAYYDKSLEEGVHRFRSHEYVKRVLSSHGWQIAVNRKLEDDEFCFAGAATSEVLEAWRTRLGFMMPRFLERYGTAATGFDSAFLQCLESEEHRSESIVWFILARSSS